MPTKGAAVSVIVPVYNAEKTLVSCIGSVLHQPFEDIEVLAVDDGSTDQSLSLLREIAAQDGRVRVFAQDNSGVAAARNLALNHAVGTYVQFVDSDDLLAPDAVLINYARETIIDEDAVDAALREGKLSWFSCDFATPKTVKMPNTFITTHSGAGTGEAEVYIDGNHYGTYPLEFTNG